MTMDYLRPQGDYISKEQFRKEVHISKRKALFLIQSGIIPAIDTHRKTRRYWIAKSDVEKYLKAREVPSLDRSAKVLCQGVLVEYNSKIERHLQKRIRELWEDQPDMMSLNSVSQLLGYHRETILNWQKRWGIEAIKTSKGSFLQKESTILFLSGPHAQKMRFKSQKHTELLRRAIYE